MKRIVSEASVVAVLGVLAALIANVISSRGLSLTRDYFPTHHKAQIGGANSGSSTEKLKMDPWGGSATSGPPAKVGTATIATEQAVQFFRDPQYEQELIVFVDARDDRHYEDGHIPGAYQLDRYYPDKHLPTVLPACLNAVLVVVYCAGGDCDDSHLAAQLLREAGVPSEHLFVYTGGVTEWDGRRLPIEVGVRKSGNLKERP